MRARTADEAGFSLIELLVVIGLLGLMAIAMSGGMHLGARAWERTSIDVDGRDAVRGGQALLRSLIENLYPHQQRETEINGPFAFSGTPIRMDFSVTPSSALHNSAIAEVELAVEQRQDGGIQPRPARHPLARLRHGQLPKLPPACARPLRLPAQALISTLGGEPRQVTLLASTESSQLPGVLTEEDPMIRSRRGSPLPQ